VETFFGITVNLFEESKIPLFSKNPGRAHMQLDLLQTYHWTATIESTVILLFTLKMTIFVSFVNLVMFDEFLI